MLIIVILAFVVLGFWLLLPSHKHTERGPIKTASELRALHKANMASWTPEMRAYVRKQIRGE